MKLFYEKTNTSEQFEWIDVPENPFEKKPTENDTKCLETAIINISIYLYG